MSKFTRSYALRLVLAFATLCLAQDSSTLDDVDPSITYSGSWQHDHAGADYLYAGTQSWTDDPKATLSFSFQGTGFDFCAGLKADRGSFTWSVDGVASGQGTQKGPSMTESQCSTVASVRNLVAGSHDVTITNTGGAYLAADSITLFADGPLTATLEAATSQATRSRSSNTFSMSPLPASSSDSVAKATISAANRTVTAEEEDDGVSSGKKAAMIGGSIAGGIVAAILMVVAYWLFRRRTSQRDSMLFPDSSPSASDLNEKNFEWNEKRPLSTAAGPAGGLPRSQGLHQNLHKRNISRQDSLEARTSAFQPETLRNQPAVEPYYPAQFTPSHSVNHSISSLNHSDVQPAFNTPPRTNNHNISNPFDVAPLRTKSSYENRLAASTAQLPDWHTHQHNQPIPRSNFLQAQQPGGDRVISDASSAYPATERHSAAYSGIEEDESPFEDYLGWEDSQVGSNDKQ